MKRRLAALASLTVAASLLAAAGCASKRPVAQGPSGPGFEASGSVAYGTFVKRGEADLQPPSPLAAMYFVGDTLISVTDRNLVYALGGSLDIRYVQQVERPGVFMRKPISFAGNTVYPTSVQLKFVDARGENVQNVTLPHPMTSDVNVDPRGYLLAGTAAPTGGRVTIIDPRNLQKPIFEETLIGTVTSAPVSLQGVVFAATDEGKVFAIGGERRVAWPLADRAFNTNRAVAADLVVDDYGVYVASTDMTLYALDRTTGRIRWRFMAQTPLGDTPLVTRDRVFQVVPNLGAVAIDKTEGDPYRTPLWTARGITKLIGVDDRYLYGVAGKNSIAAIDLATGDIRFDVKGDFAYFAQAPDKTIYAAEKSGRVFSFARAPYTGQDNGVAAR